MIGTEQFRPNWRIFDALAVLGLLALAGYLRLNHLTDKSMWWDEVQVLVAVPRSFFEIHMGLYHDQHQPLFYFLVKIFDSISRDDFVRKIPSWLPGILVVGALYLLGKEWTDRRVALIASLLLAVNLPHIEQSQMLRMYALLTFLGMLSTFALYRFIESEGKASALWAYAITTSLALHTHASIVPLIAFQVLYVVYLGAENFVHQKFAYPTRFFWSDQRKSKQFQLFVLFSIALMVLFWISVRPKVEFIALLGGVFLLLPLISPVVVKDWKPLLSAHLFKRGLLLVLVTALLSPFFLHSLYGAIASFYHRPELSSSFSGETITQSFALQQNRFLAMSTTLGYRSFLGIQHNGYYPLLFFPLGIFLAWVRGKRWVLLATFHSLYFFVLIGVIGYNRFAISLGDRFFLPTLPFIFLLTAVGLVWGVELLVTYLSKILIFISLISSPRLVSLKLAQWSQAFIKATTLIVLVGFSAKEWGAHGELRENWYNTKWVNWHSLGEFLDQNLPKKAIFITNSQNLQYMVSVNTNKETNKKIMYSFNDAQDYRPLWIIENGVDKENKLFQKSLVKDGFKEVFTLQPGDVHLYTKNVRVEPLIEVSPGIDRKWKWGANGFGGQDRLEFIKKAYSMHYLSPRLLVLTPTVDDVPASLVYQFEAKNPQELERFQVKLGYKLESECFIKVLASEDGEAYQEVFFTDDPTHLGKIIELTEFAKRGKKFFVQLQLQSTWNSKRLTGSLNRAMLTEVEFSATYQN
ncbi:MAG: glycosyltransferase family 39 protein [bacterium]|nr:glycosyltransferase family 39 protein [bacterium]